MRLLNPLRRRQKLLHRTPLEPLDAHGPWLHEPDFTPMGSPPWRVVNGPEGTIHVLDADDRLVAILPPHPKQPGNARYIRAAPYTVDLLWRMISPVLAPELSGCLTPDTLDEVYHHLRHLHGVSHL